MIITPAVRGFLGAVQGLSFTAPPIQLPGATGIVATTVVKLGGIATVSGGISAQVSNNGTIWSSSTTILAAGTVYVKSNAPLGWGASTTLTVTVGTQVGMLTVQSCTEPTFTFPELSNAAPGTAAATASQPTGCTLGGTVTLTSSAGTGPTVSPNPVTDLGNLVVNYIGRSGWGLSDTIGVSLNGYTASFTVSTPAFRLG